MVRPKKKKVLWVLTKKKTNSSSINSIKSKSSASSSLLGLIGLIGLTGFPKIKGNSNFPRNIPNSEF